MAQHYGSTAYAWQSDAGQEAYRLRDSTCMKEEDKAARRRLIPFPLVATAKPKVDDDEDDCACTVQ
jgi:hypothetical protein